MNEEEKKAIEELKDCLGNSCLYIKEEYGCSFFDDEIIASLKTILNLIEKQQTIINKALKFIADNRYTDDNGCGYEWEGMTDIDKLVSILKGEK